MHLVPDSINDFLSFFVFLNSFQRSCFSERMTAGSKLARPKQLSLVAGIVMAFREIRKHCSEALWSTATAALKDRVFCFFLLGSFSAFGILVSREYLKLCKLRKCKKHDLCVSTKGSITESRHKLTRKPDVDSTFWIQLKALLSIAFPSVFAKSSRLLIAQFFLLVMRTELNIKTSKMSIHYLTTAISKASWKYWTKWFVSFSGWMVCGVVVNSGLKYVQDLIEMEVRASLTRHAHEVYLGKGVQSFYRAAVMSRGGSLDNIDQRISADIESFAANIAFLYGHSFKPVLEFFLSLSEAAKEIGYKRPLTLLVIELFVDAGLRTISPQMGAIVAEQTAMEGAFRTAHTRLISYAEQVSFLRGQETEKSILNAQFEELIALRRWNYLKKIGKSVAMQVGKFQGMLVGGIFVHIPFLVNPHHSESEQISRFRSTEALMLRCGQAFVEMLQLNQNLQKLSGFTHRIHEFFHALENRPESLVRTVGDIIRFKDVSVSPPIGPEDEVNRLLISNLTLEIVKGKSVIVTGPNGSGKSSMFRVLAGLWPPRKGSVVCAEDVLWLPQKSYLVMGTLRDQISYPQRLLMDRSRDDEILKCLRDVGLERLAEYSSDLDTMYLDWDGMLSGGERQRIGFARLFFHRPQFAVLDEATSAINADEEKGLYEKLVDQYGITLLSIAHRLELKKYHQWELRIKGDGTGQWDLISLEEDK